MKIAIATIGRFHVLDLGRELAALGHEVAFYSILPRSRAIRFGLPASAHRGLLPWLLPMVVAQRYGGTWLRHHMDPLLQVAADRLIARQSKTPSTSKVEGERGSASSRFGLGECALALAFRLEKIIAHLGE